MPSERRLLTSFFAAIDGGEVIALSPDRERYDQSDGHDEARQEAQRRGVDRPVWLFWHHQADGAFDASGALTSALRVNWGGDHDRVAALLAGIPEPFVVTDNGPGGVFEIASTQTAVRAAAPLPEVTDTAAVKARIRLVTERDEASRSPAEWQWLNDVLVGGDVAAQGYVVRHLAGSEHLRDDAFDALMTNWARIYAKAPDDVLVSDLLSTLHARHDPRLEEVIATSVKRKRYTFRSGVSYFLAELGDPARLPLLYELAQTPGEYEHTPGDGAALRGWLDISAAQQARPVEEVATEALDDPNFDAAARRELRRVAGTLAGPKKRSWLERLRGVGELGD